MLIILSKNIRIKLAELNMTANDLSESTGITNSELSKLLNNKKNDIKHSTLNKIAVALDMKAWELLKEGK